MIFIWALLIAATAVGNTNGAGISRIVGGTETSIQNYPSLAQVEFRNALLFWSQTCAANILTNRYLVSCAHCFGGFLFSISQRRIRAGTTFREDGGFIYELEKYIPHPDYGKNGFDADIALLLITTDFTFSAGVRPIRFVPQGFELFDNLPVLHAGWGATGVAGSGGSSPQLRHAQVYVINHDECKSRYQQLSNAQSRVTENMVCAGVLDVSDRDTCDGDDGGPMYLNRDVLVGIVSWGRSCADAYYPRVNTKIASYSDWLSGIIATCC